MSRHAAWAVAREGFRHVSRTVRRRAAGAAVAAPDWMDPGLIESLALPLRGPGGQGPVLQVAVREGFFSGALPSRIRLGAGLGELPVRMVRAPRARAQGAPALQTQGAPSSRGTATCLVRDRLNPLRNYLVTCAHVVAPTAQSRVNDQVVVQQGPSPGFTAFLAEWQPGLGAGAYRSSIDAALLEVREDDARALRADPALLPMGTCGDIARELPVTVRRVNDALPGTMQVYWSGWMDVALTPGYQDYFLDDAIGYLTAAPTSPGDSGAALWNEREELVGMHLGSIEGGQGGLANAVFGKIGPVLQWFSVQPYTRLDPFASPPVEVARARVDLPPPPAASAGAVDYEVEIVAKTLWGEARGEGRDGMHAVACVIRNRKQRRHRGLDSYSAVCLSPWQFSCWNAGDANRRKLDALLREPDAPFRDALAVAQALVRDGGLADITDKATHYYATTLRQPPYWARGKTPCARLGKHLFFNDID